MKHRFDVVTELIINCWIEEPCIVGIEYQMRGVLRKSAQGGRVTDTHGCRQLLQLGGAKPLFPRHPFFSPKGTIHFRNSLRVFLGDCLGNGTAEKAVCAGQKHHGGISFPMFGIEMGCCSLAFPSKATFSNSSRTTCAGRYLREHVLNNEKQGFKRLSKECWWLFKTGRFSTAKVCSSWFRNGSRRTGMHAGKHTVFSLMSTWYQVVLLISQKDIEHTRDNPFPP